jgi:predicted ester cyclase
MTPDEIETRYCQYVEDVLNHHHLDALARYMTTEVVSHVRGIPSGRAGARKLIEGLIRVFPDIHLTIDTVAAIDSELVARMTATGTQCDTFLGIRPTGRRICVSAFAAWHVRDGQCAEQWLQLDLDELFQQLGAEITAT